MHPSGNNSRILKAALSRYKGVIIDEFKADESVQS